MILQKDEHGVFYCETGDIGSFCEALVGEAKKAMGRVEGCFNDTSFYAYPDSSPRDLTTIYSLTRELEHRLRTN